LARPAPFRPQPERAAALAARFGVPWLPLEALPNASVDLLISSRLGDLAEDYWPKPQGPQPRALDLRTQSPWEAAPAQSAAFKRDALQRGFEHQDGRAMLIHQALAQFDLFHGLQTSSLDLAAVLEDLAQRPR
jgi:shikimate 5-dehydrogenase